MTGDQQYNIGKKNSFQIDFGKLKSGIKADEFKDNSAMLEIFNASDSNKNSVLEDNEVSVFVDKLVQAAGEDNTLTESETKSILKQEAEAQRQAGQKTSLSKAKSKDVFSFLNKWQNLSEKSTVKSSTVQGDQRVVLYEDGAQEVINKDGSRILTTVSGGIKSVKSFGSNGKLEKEENTDEETGIIETILYDEDGNVTEHKRTGKNNNNQTVTQILDDSGRPSKEIINEGQEDESISEYVYTDDNSYTKTTASGNEKSTIVVKDGEISTIDAAQYENGVKVRSYSKDEEGNETTVLYNSDGKKVVEDIVGVDGSIARNIYNPGNGKKQASILQKDGQTYQVQYDGKGNTIVVVQNGETVDKICHDFKITAGELAAANKGNLHKNQSTGKYYFTAGQEIRIAGELPPNHPAIKGRTTSAQARAQYTQQAYQRTAERINGKEQKEVTIRKNYSSLSEYAVDLLRSEGISNPSKQQIASKTTELVLLNGNIVPKKGQKIIAVKTNAEIRREQARLKAEQEAQKKAEEAQAQREAVAKVQKVQVSMQATSIAATMYKEITAFKINSVGRENFQKALKQVTADNVVETLAAYDKQSPNESLAKAMSWEETSISAVKDASKYILNKLVERAKKSGVKQSIINDLKTKGEEALSHNRANDMDRIFQGFAQAIRNVENLTNEERSAVSDLTSEQKVGATVGLLTGIATDAEESFNDQLDSDGWAGKTVDWMSGAWNSKNRKSVVQSEIKAYKNQIAALKNCKTEAEFKAKFKEIYGVDFDPVQIAAYEKMQAKYQTAAKYYSIETSFNNSLSNLLGHAVLEDETVTTNPDPETRICFTTVTATKAVVYDRELKKFAQFLGMGNEKAGMAQINEEFRKAGLTNASIDQKYAFLHEKAKSCSQLLHQQTMAATGGKDFKIVQNEYNNSYVGAFGTKNDIAYRVNKYNDSQQVGAAVLKSGIKIAAGVAIGIATGGSGVVPLLVAAGAQTSVCIAVDVSDLATSKKGGTFEQYYKIVKDDLLNGAAQVVTGGASQLIRAADLGKAATYILNTVVDTGSDVAVEYLQTGEITWQTAVMSAGFSLGGQFIGDAIETRAQRKADNEVASKWADMTQEQQLAYVENDPRWSKAIQSNKDPMHNDELLPKNWSSMTAEQKAAFNQQRQIASEVWKSRTVYPDMDPMLRPIPREFETPADFDSLPKEEQKAFKRKQNEVFDKRQQDHATWLTEHQGVEADARTGLTSDAHHRYVQDYSSDELGRAGIQLDGSNGGSTVSMDGQAVVTASGERVEISYGQYVDAKVDGEFFRSSGLNQDITDLNVRLYGHGSADAAALNGVDVNSRSALSRTPKAVEMGLTDDKLLDVAHGLATNAYSGRALPADSGFELIDEISDAATGLHAKAYKQADGNIFIAYSGSSDKLDFRVDHQMIDGQRPAQLTGAIEFKDKIKQQFPDAELIVTGHSLGGSLSELVASSDADVLAITFDAVGTKNIVQNTGLTDFGNSCNIVVVGDNISNACEHVGSTTKMNGNGFVGQVTRPDGEVVAVRTNSAHSLDATANASRLIGQRELELNEIILSQAPPVADVSGRNYSMCSRVVEVTTAEATNNWWKDNGYTEPPYLPNTEVKIIELTEPTTFVRVLDGDNSGVFGGWVMKAEDLLRPDGTPLTPLEIQQKFALKTTPTHVVDVTLPAGTQLRMGEVNPLEAWGKRGGGTQFDLMGQRVGQFDNARRIQEFKFKK